MKTYHVEIQGSANTRTIDCFNYEEAVQTYREATEAGTPAQAYYIESDKIYDLFTEEEIQPNED